MNIIRFCRYILLFAHICADSKYDIYPPRLGAENLPI
jgi:hypothetical protein